MKFHLPSRIALVAISAAHLLPLHAAEAAGQKFEQLTTTRSRTYQAVTVREITPSGVKIIHESGTATIPYQELPSEVQEKLGGFDPAAAEQHRTVEEAKLRQTEAAHDRDLSEALAATEAQAAAAALGTQERDAPPAPAESDPFGGGLLLPGDAASAGTPPDVSGLLSGPGLQGVGVTGPESGSFALPGDDFSSATPSRPVPRAAPAPPSGESKVAAAEKGVLSVRIVGYRSGAKRIEIKATTNCPAEVQVGAAIELPDTFRVTSGVPFTRQIWVRNGYSVTLQSDQGRQLDYETWDKKTDTFQRPTLR